MYNIDVVLPDAVDELFVGFKDNTTKNNGLLKQKSEDDDQKISEPDNKAIHDIWRTVLP